MILRSRARKIADRLRAEIKRQRKSQAEVAREFGVTQPRISRVLKGEFTRRSTLAPALCEKYLGVEVREELDRFTHDEAVQDAFETAIHALELMWDGSSQHATRLRRLIAAVQSAPGSAPGPDRTASPEGA